MRIPRIGDKVKIRGHDMFTDTVCTVTSVGLSTILVRPFRARDVISVDEDDIIFLDPETLTGKEKRAILTRLIGDRKLETKEYIQELAMLNRLITQFPDCEFWRSFQPFCESTSIRLYMVPESIERIKCEYNKSKLEFEPKVHNIGDKKLGEDIVFEKFKLD